MSSKKSKQTMHNVIRKIKPNDASGYRQIQIKCCVMLPSKGNQAIHHFITEIKPNNI